MKAPRTVRIVAGIVGVAILVGLVGSATAEAITNTYQFSPDQSSVHQTGGVGGISETYSIQGFFQITHDYETLTASFDQVDATLTGSGYLNEYDLGTLFYMTELDGHVAIPFAPHPQLIVFQGRTHEISGTDYINCLIDIDGSLQLTGRFRDPYVDGFQYDLDAFAFPALDTPHPGDANHDYMVSADDFASIQAHFGETGDLGILGDANIDGVVSADDYGAVIIVLGGDDNVVYTPEPATLGLLAIGGLAMLRRRSAQVLRPFRQAQDRRRSLRV